MDLIKREKAKRDFFVSCRGKGNIFNFRKYIETGASVLVVDMTTQKSPLHFVCDSPPSTVKAEMARVLIINTREWEYLYGQDVNGKMPLDYALANRSMEIARMLLFPSEICEPLSKKAMSVHVEKICIEGSCILHWSCSSLDPDYAKVAEWLVSSTSLNALTNQILFGYQDENGDTPLFIALRANKFHLSTALIMQKGAFRGENNRGQTALHIACSMQNLKDVGEIIRSLVRKCPSLLEVQDDNGDTPLHCIARIRGFENDVWYEGLLRTVFKAKSRSPLVQNNDGEIPLHIASSVLFVICMVEYGYVSYLNALNNLGQSPFYNAVMHRRYTMWKCMASYSLTKNDQAFYLFDHNFEIDGDLLVYWCLKDPAWHDLARILIINRRIPLDTPIRSIGGLSLLQYLFSREELFTFVDSIIFKRSQEVRLAAVLDEEDNNPLHVGFIEKNPQLVWLLLSQDSNGTYLTRNHHGDYPLHCAARYLTHEVFLQFACSIYQRCDIRHVKERNIFSRMVEYVKPHADIFSALNNAGDTAFHITCSTGNISFFLSILPEYIARNLIDVKNGKDQSPLLAACAAIAGKSCLDDDNHHANMNRLIARIDEINLRLIESGASIDAVDNTGTNVMQYACRGGYLRTVQKILNGLSNEERYSQLCRQSGTGFRAVDGLLRLFSPFILDQLALKILKSICEKEVNLSRESVDGMSTVVWACVESSRRELARMLIMEQRVSLENLTVNGMPLVAWVCLDMERMELARMLVVGRRIDVTGIRIGCLPLLEWACLNISCLELARMLIMECSFPEEALQQVLLKACQDPQLLEVTRILILDKKISMDSIYIEGMHIIVWAVRAMERFRYSLAEMLLIDRELPYNHLHVDGMPLLLWVCSKICHFGAMRQALEYLLRNPHCDLDIQDAAGDTALHIACRLVCENSKCLDIVSMLRSTPTGRHASVNVQNHSENTPLHEICAMSSTRNERVCRHLFEKLLAKLPGDGPETDLNIQNAQGNTPLHILCDRKKKNLTGVLLQYQLYVNFDLRNKDGKTAWELAGNNREWSNLLRRAKRRTLSNHPSSATLDEL